MTILKNRLSGGRSTLPYAVRFAAPGLLRGPTITLAPEDDSGGGPGDDGGEPKAIDPAAHDALAKAHDRLKKDAKADRDALKTLREEMDAIKADKDRAEEDKAKATGDVDAIRTQLETKHTRELKGVTDRAEKAERQVQKLVIDNGLSAALDAARVKLELKDGAVAMLSRGVTIDEDDDGEPIAMKGGLPLAEAIRIWAESDDGKPYVLAGNSGGDAPGGGKRTYTGKNPWQAGATFNLTEQDQIARDKPELAKRLMAEAGVA